MAGISARITVAGKSTTGYSRIPDTSTAGGIVGDTIPPAVEAVSYTHLRAHETVLELVCRLLLEKKKKHISKH
ncbi:hypothetical protein AMBR_BLFENHAL_02891 [Lacticaseibacillus rhamnosus]|nr:hypothetical protein AMBR_BLFENHAL_02891 [Lacticaseibacillus rhamnosus]